MSLLKVGSITDQPVDVSVKFIINSYEVAGVEEEGRCQHPLPNLNETPAPQAVVLCEHPGLRPASEPRFLLLLPLDTPFQVWPLGIPAHSSCVSPQRERKLLECHV